MAELKKVVLYKHGVGYFEREAKVTDNAELKLGFRSEEMNDVLKSLTVFDSGGGNVSFISYDNQKPVSRLLEESSLEIPSEGGSMALLAGLRGATVQVSAGTRSLTGRIVGVENRTTSTAHGEVESPTLTLLDEHGSMHTFEARDISSVRFLDEHLRNELNFLFETHLMATKRDTKNLKLFARGQGERQLSISYVVECPIWKTSYRVALSEDTDNPTFLQGWALVDNPQDEDWTNVELSLVSGLPISFTHDLYSPRYLKRKEVEVAREAAAGPVTSESALMELDEVEDEMDYVGGRGGGGARMRAMPAMAMAPAPSPPKPVAKRMAASQNVETVAQTVGQLFEYRIDHPVTVLRNQSALVPIVGSPFQGGRKILYNESNRAQNPFAVIDFKNTTGLTLEGGPLTVYEDDVYAGEAMLDTTGPDEQRYIAYAVDLAVEVKTVRENDENITLEVLNKGLWTQRSARFSKTTYRFSNRSKKAKTVVVEHPIQHGKLVKTPEPISESRNYWRFQVELAPQKSTVFAVTVRSEDTQSQNLSSQHFSQILLVLRGARAAESLHATTEKVIALYEESHQADEEQRIAQQRMNEIGQEHGRIRENLAALNQSHDEARLRTRYITTLEQQEDELRELHAQIVQALARRDQLQKQLQALISSIDFKQVFEEE